MGRKNKRSGSPSLGGKTNPKRHQSKGIVSRHDTSHKTRRSEETFEKGLHVASDLRRDPTLSFTRAARNREIDPRSILKHERLGSHFRQDRPGEKIQVTKSDRLHVTMWIDSTQPGVLTPIETKGNKQRQLVARWKSAVDKFAAGDPSEIRAFPRGQFVGGVRLPTGAYEVQRIVEAMAETQPMPYSLYRGITAGAS